ncbi:MAG: hypothetical protein AB7G44_01175 [Bacteroidia bacterium]
MSRTNSPGLFADVSNPGNHLVKILWSGFYFALAFILINYFHHFITAFCAALLEHDPVFSYNGVKPIAAAASPWTLKRVAFIYLTAPLICLLISAGLTLLLYTSYSNSHLSLFLFWLALNAFGLFYSYFFTGILGSGKYTSIFYTGFSLFLSWLYLSSATITVLMVLFIILFSFAALAFVPIAMRYNYSVPLIKTRTGRKMIFINTVLFPFAAGTILMLLITYPLDKAYTIVRIAGISVILLMMFLGMLRINKKSSAIIQKGGIRYASPLLLVAGILMLTVTVKYVLSTFISL